MLCFLGKKMFVEYLECSSNILYIAQEFTPAQDKYKKVRNQYRKSVIFYLSLRVNDSQPHKQSIYMQVLCIDAAPRPDDYEDGPVLEFLRPYSVVDECLGVGSDGVYKNCYELAEFPSSVYGPGNLFETDRFISVQPGSIIQFRKPSEVLLCSAGIVVMDNACVA